MVWLYEDKSKQRKEDEFYLRALLKREQSRQMKHGTPGGHSFKRRIKLPNLRSATPDQLKEALNNLRNQ